MQICIAIWAQTLALNVFSLSISVDLGIRETEQKKYHGKTIILLSLFKNQKYSYGILPNVSWCLTIFSTQSTTQCLIVSYTRNFIYIVLSGGWKTLQEERKKHETNMSSKSINIVLVVIKIFLNIWKLIYLLNMYCFVYFLL